MCYFFVLSWDNDFVVRVWGHTGHFVSESYTQFVDSASLVPFVCNMDLKDWPVDVDLGLSRLWIPLAPDWRVYLQYTLSQYFAHNPQHATSYHFISRILLQFMHKVLFNPLSFISNLHLKWILTRALLVIFSGFSQSACFTVFVTHIISHCTYCIYLHVVYIIVVCFIYSQTLAPVAIVICWSYPTQNKLYLILSYLMDAL